MKIILSLLFLAASLTVPGVPQQEPVQDPPPSEVQRLQAHYRAVIAELSATDVSGLDQPTLTERRRTIAALSEYCERGDFGRRQDKPGGRTNLFLDQVGRPCAVAYLLQEWGEDELVGRVANTYNEAFVAELAEDAELGAWLEQVGLTLAEAARIQGPGIGRGGGPGFEGPPVEVMQPRAPAPGPSSPWSAPGSGAPASGPASPSTPAGPAPNGAAPATSPTAPMTPSPVTALDLSTHWWTWWEFNKLTWIIPERAGAFRSSAPVQDGRTFSGQNDALRREWLPVIQEQLDDGNGRVRAAAIVAYARVAGEQAVDAALELLGDPQEDVRRAAILALGATGSERAVHALLRIAHTGAYEERGRIMPDARPLAVIALGLARERGGAEGIERMLPLEEDKSDRIQEASAMHPFLADSGALTPWIRTASGIFDGTKPARKVDDPLERGIEALRFQEPEEVLAALLHATSSRQVEVRRSSALTLGEIEHEGVIGPLRTAFEMEREPLTRGFLLLAIANQGGTEARDFLARTMKTGPKVARPWCALALGVLARADDDDEARRVLMTAYSKERNRDARGAYLLAFGVARDPKAADLLRWELRESKSALDRSFAALSLGLIGGLESNGSSAGALREALEEETTPFTRSSIAQALGYLGEPVDARLLVDELRDANHPIIQVQLAAAAGFHGSVAVGEELVSLLKEEGSSATARASALQALGMLLDSERPFLLAALSSKANFSVFPTWLDQPLQSTL